jgi:hypothetical protein
VKIVCASIAISLRTSPMRAWFNSPRSWIRETFSHWIGISSRIAGAGIALSIYSCHWTEVGNANFVP